MKTLNKMKFLWRITNDYCNWFGKRKKRLV